MRTALQLLGGIAVAGAVAAGSTALTGTGLNSSAASSAFIGGTVTQTVTGSPDLTNIVYHYTDATDTIVDTATLTFATTMAARTVGATVHYGGSTATPTCVTSTVTVVCTISSPVVGMTAFDVTVS